MCTPALAAGVIAIAVACPVSGSQAPPAAPASAPFFREVDPSFTWFETCFQLPIDSEHTLLVVRASRLRESRCGSGGTRPWTSRWYWGKEDAFGVFLTSRRAPGRLWLLTMLGKPEREGSLRLERADGETLVLWEGDDGYGFGTRRVKFFFDARERGLIDRVEYSIRAGAARFEHAGQRICATILTSRGDRVACSDGGPFEIQTTDTIPAVVVEPPASELPALPQSSYDEFARARPARVANNYHRQNTIIEETVGPWQRVGNRIWFGKTFYDGEGRSGVGGLGVFDTETRRFSFIAPQEILAWSASALLIEGNTAWVGLVGHPEGADDSGGLLRIDLTTRRAQQTEVPDIVTGIVRWRGALYLATTNGIYVVGDRTLRRFRLEPDRSGAWVIVADELPRSAGSGRPRS